MGRSLRKETQRQDLVHDMTERREYTFLDQTQRNDVATINVADFAIDNKLGESESAAVLVKWTNQRYHDENLQTMFSDDWDEVTGTAKRNRWRHRNQYYAGKIAQISLGVDYIDATSAYAIIDAVQPTGISQNQDGMTALACGDVINLTKTPFSTNEPVAVISHDNFARLHSVEFNETGDKLLTASSALDLLYEVDLLGNPIWSMDMWDTPFNINTLGQQFHRTIGRLAVGCIFNPDVEQLINNSDFKDKSFVIDDPRKYNHLGLTTNLTPVFPNSVSYGLGEDILVTTFHKGFGWIIDRTNNTVQIIKDGMKNPHGFQRDNLMDGYMVTDTGNETISFLSPDFKYEQVFDLSRLGQKKPGLDKAKWLQYTTRISDDVYCAVLAPRQAITLFNPHEQTRRDIPFDADWGIQQVVSV